MNQYIKDVKLDEVKRIIIEVKPQFQSYLQENQNRQMLKKYVTDLLKEEFVKLEIGKNLCRITVKKGTEEKNLQRVNTELIKSLEMAIKFLSKMGK